ncbi:MAG: TetR/AcrR family transcriptional regulator [Pseudomonadota bacterium]
MKSESQPKRGRGRPRAFDVEAALSSAATVFHAKGFDATSLDDLSDATGLTRPSLYAAFGDKEAFYLAALRQVTADMEAHLAEAVAAPGTLEDSLRRFYSAAIARYAEGPAGACGCIIMTTGVARAPNSEAVQSYVALVLKGLDEAISQLYAKKYKGAAAERKSKELLAVSTLQTLSIRARAGAQRPALESIVEAVLPALV